MGQLRQRYLKKDINIELPDENTIQLDVPQNVSADFKRPRWTLHEFMRQNDVAAILLNRTGILNAGVEVYFPDLSLLQGTNIIKVSYIGGLYLQNERIKLSTNSDALYFSVTVDSSGNLTAERM